MNIKLLFLLFHFYSICYSSIINTFDSISNLISYNINNTDVIKVLLNNLLKEISNVTFESDENYVCFNSLFNNIFITKKVFSACGKYLGDFGFEDLCNEIKTINNVNVNYFLLNFTLNFTLFNESSQYNELLFLNESKSIIGFCMYDSCMGFLKKFIDRNNSKFINFINQNGGIENGILRFVENDSFDEQIKNKHIDFWIFIISIFLICIWSFFMILYFFIQICINKKYDKKLIISDKNDKELEYKEENYDEYIEFNNKNQNNEKEEITEPKHFLNYDITKNIQKLFTLSNDLYNNKGLEQISFIRNIIAFFIIYYYTFYALIYFPPKDQFNPNFFTSFFFSLIRLSGMSFIGYIILDGMIMSFKLMCKIRNYLIYEVNSEISVGLFFKFFCNSFSNIFIFFFIFGIFYNCSIYFNYNPVYDNFKGRFNLGFLFNYYSQYFLLKENNEIFLNNILDIFYIPFKYFNESINFFKDLNKNNIKEYTIMKSFTYDFVYISINEFYSFIFSLILIYFCCYKRSKRIDISIFIIILIYSVLSVIIFGKITLQKEVYDIKYKMVINQDWFEKNPFLFLNVYLIGVIIGIMYFYYKDMKSNVQLYNYYDNTDNEYPPFNYCAKFVRWLIPMKKNVKKIILFFSIFIILLCSFDFSLFVCQNKNYPPWSVFNNNTKDNESKKNQIILFYHFTYYSKVIFIIFFSIILILLLSFSSSDFIYYCIHFKIFNFIERESRIILCSSQAVLLFCVCAFRYQFIFEHKTFFIHSIGIYLFNLLVATIISIFIEVPIKEIIKYITRTHDWDVYYSKELTNEISDENFSLVKDLINDKLIRENIK